MLAALAIDIDQTNITKTVLGFACRSLRSPTVFVPIFAGYKHAVPLRDHIYIFSRSLRSVKEARKKYIEKRERALSVHCKGLVSYVLGDPNTLEKPDLGRTKIWKQSRC